MNGKRLCSTSHPATVRGERARRLFQERGDGVLWHHSSVNLVKSRDHRTGRGVISPAKAEDQNWVSIADSAPQPWRREKATSEKIIKGPVFLQVSTLAGRLLCAVRSD